MAAKRKTTACPPGPRALVTGAAGFIGSHLTDELLARGYAVVGADSFLANYGREIKEANLARAREHASFSFVETDLARENVRELAAGVDVIFHLAARPGVRDSWGQHYEEYLANNVLATQHLLEALKDRPDVRFVLASSSSVYGDAAKLPVREDAKLLPVSPYGATKLAAEDLVHLYAKSYGLKAVILRYFTVFGPRQRPDMAIYKFIRAVGRGEPLTIFGGRDERRDFTYVGDVVKATADVYEKDAPVGVYNVASGRTITLDELVAAVEKALAKKAQVSRAPHQPGDVRATHGDIRALKKAIGYAPAAGFEEGLAAQAEWMAGLTTQPAPPAAAPKKPPAVRLPALSVVIVNYNAGHVVEKSIASCWENAPAGVDIEIIVVDNASADGSAEALATRDDIVFIRNRQNVGYAAANNQGIARARGEYIMLMNPDVEATPGLFTRLMDFLAETRDAGVAGPALVSPNGRLQESYRRFPNLVHLIGNRRSLLYRFWRKNPFSRAAFYGDLDLSKPAGVDFIAGAVMMFKRELVELIGPMDAKYFMYVEDADFCRRARDAGFRTYLLPDVHAVHLWGESSSFHPYRMVFMHHLSMMRYFLRHQPLQFAVYILLAPAVAAHIASELIYARRAARRRRKRLAAEAPSRAGGEAAPDAAAARPAE